MILNETVETTPGGTKITRQTVRQECGCIDRIVHKDRANDVETSRVVVTPCDKHAVQK